MSDVMRNPLKNARGLGSAKSGVHHFVVQRLTALALVFLSIWFVWFVLGLFQVSYADARVAIAHPYNAILLIVFVIAMFWHAQLGLQVVVEDYVHAGGLALTTQVAIKFLCALGAVTGVFAIARTAFGS